MARVQIVAPKEGPGAGVADAAYTLYDEGVKLHGAARTHPKGEPVPETTEREARLAKAADTFATAAQEDLG